MGVITVPSCSGRNLDLCLTLHFSHSHAFPWLFASQIALNALLVLAALIFSLLCS